jgi:hypothetical protein
VTLQIQPVAIVLAQHQLQNPSLPFLSLEHALVRILMFQPEGTIVANKTRVGVQDHQLIIAQMQGFLANAATLNVDIAVCPEYSCPWAALIDSIEAGVVPSEGTLWALGCESATPAELAAAMDRLKQKVIVVFDDSVLAKHGNFVDCLCYVFRTNRANGDATHVVLIQTKTQPMGGDDFELDNLKLGRALYRFKNSNTHASNNLIGLLCSDTLHPQFDQLIPQLQTDSLILHLQLNANPSSPGFRQYRSNCCSHTPRTTEILCLNWARGTNLLGQDGTSTPFITEPKTIFFRPTGELKTDDAHILENHSKGCYLTNWQEHRTAAFVFSPDSRLFLFETTKPSIAGNAATAIRTGPKMLDTFSWNMTASVWESKPPDDRFKSYWRDEYVGLQPLLDPLLGKLLEAERLIQLCVGHASDGEWAHWTNLPSFRLMDDDTAQRLTLCWSTSGSGYIYRKDCLALFRGFAGTINDPSQFSDRLVAFRDAPFHVAYKSYPLTKVLRNLHLKAGLSATGVYLGQTPATERLEEVKKRISAVLHMTESDTQLMALWYRDDVGNLRDFMDEDIPKINADPGVSPVAIVNTAP